MNNNKVALITGASKGIGAAIAKKLASQNIKVAINYNSSQLDALQVKNEITALGGVAEVFKADVSDRQAVSRLFEEVESVLGQVNLLVNNAGVVENRLLTNMEEEAWDKVIDTNLKACFLVSQRAASAMCRSRFGRILNIASTCGFVGTVGQVNYSASKGGIIAMTRSMAKELSSYNITVNSIAPGFIETDMTDGFDSSPQGRQVLKKILMSRPGTVAEVANMAAFLLSDENSYMTGQSVVLDGGLSV
ncbi:hypothetical protein N473_17775 [Pseudoalteromonas luteoviolacea CPMOR-1]|uniref:Ketoreductase domain-containing protein n=1 Tax=Pseudoalteromonas luteoviolacea CPMOR-1 TaxID=1365248 RepID=A0A167KU92_9GAMM|nr:3-oxoacyl-ACP reductase FabG [Pseudoalteromonas luteoviolacea]KZN63278.1 hypothetical protein N473_17775 [Pseudoalteromonas luteoviolacea CPMOR-1]